MKINIQFRHTILFLVILIIIPSCAINPVTGKKQIMLLSESQEAAMGAEYDPQVVATFGLYENEPLTRLLNEKAAEMGKISHRPNVNYQVKILDSPVVNAFAVPGGYIYFTRGILAQFNNEAEMIGVLGHEMGHITARHTASQQSKQQLGQLLLVGGMIASEKFREFGEYAMQGMQLLFLKFSRDNENQSDQLGVEYASKIGYDARKMANFFNVLDKMQMSSEQGGVPTFLSTHPNPSDRYYAVNSLADAWQDSLKLSNWTVNQNEYLRMIDGLVYGEDPRQGFVENGVFYHPELKFRYPIPPGWQLVNSPLQVQMAPADGKALIVFSLSGQKTPEEALRKNLEDLKLTLVDSKKITVNGFPAVASVSKQVSQDQQTGQEQAIMVMSYFIDYNDMIFTFHGVSEESEFNNYATAFESTMKGFSRLTDAAKLNAQPKRIQIQTVQRNGTAREILASMGVPASQLNEIALLNEVSLTDQLPKGALVKIVK
ncbi:MAG: M48 family metalloprotease [Prolixibacteraceae bacterium]|nr:M48 family metalloprotease [Prolixibacteraceae bacterium]